MGLEIISELKRKRGLTNEKLSELSGVPLGTLAKITSGVTRDPKLETLKALARVLNCSLQDFDDEPTPLFTHAERELLFTYRALDEPGRRVVSLVALAERDRLFSSCDGESKMMREYTSLESAASACAREGRDYTLISRDSLVPRGAEFAVRVTDDSLAPYATQGGRVFVTRSEEVADGEIGVFSIGSSLIFMQYCEDKSGNVDLFAVNRARSDRDIAFMAGSKPSLLCFGRVLIPKK